MIVYLKTRLELARQRLLENGLVVHTGLLLLTVVGLALALLQQRQRAAKLFSQVHRATRLRWMRKLVEPYITANLPAIYTDSGPTADANLPRYFGNRLMVLKAPAANGEKGVLFVMVSYIFDWIRSNMDLKRLLEDYTLVFEPSWSGYCFSGLLNYTRWKDEVFVLSAEEGDFAFLERLNSNLVPLELGPCDWVDPDAAKPYLTDQKEFDIVMNSNWAGWKRHYVLFRMLRNAKRRYKVALIGVKWGSPLRIQADIRRLADYYGVTSQLTIFDEIPYQQVMEITCRSRVSILLSLKEGSNRAIAESILSDVPVIVLANHVGGIRKNIVPETGLLAEERHLAAAVDRLLESHLSPRTWGLEHVSCLKSSEKLNAILREHALSHGRPWTQDIAVRSNSPDSTYKYSSDAERLRAWNEGLRSYLR